MSVAYQQSCMVPHGSLTLVLSIAGAVLLLVANVCAGNGGILSAHPHWDAWQQLPDLVRDGISYSKALVSGGSVSAGGRTATKSSSDEFEQILDDHDGTPTRPVARGRRKSEPGAKKKKRKAKPRPSLPLISNDDAGGLE